MLAKSSCAIAATGISRAVNQREMKFQGLNYYYISTMMSCLRSNATICHMVEWSTSQVGHCISELSLVSEVDGVLYMSHETILVGLAMRNMIAATSL